MKLVELEVVLGSLSRVHKEGLIEMILSLDGRTDETSAIPPEHNDTARLPAPPPRQEKSPRLTGHQN